MSRSRKFKLPALLQHHRWRADNNLVENGLPPQIGPWLSDKGSLTAALRSIADNTFQVRVLDQKITIPYWHEQRILGRPLHLAALVREVELTIFDEAVVFARSIIPLKLANRGQTGLASLGRTPLGHLLFKDGGIRVSKREFLTISSQQNTLYARRTPYDYQDTQILVSEFFLPSFDKYLSD